MDPERHATRIVTVLFAVMSLGSAAYIAAATVSPIAGTALAGHDSWAGVPSAAVLLGAAVCAPIWGALMDRVGRRWALVLGLVAGLVGSAIAAAALAGHSLVGFLIGLVLMGAASAAIQLSRFAAAEVHAPDARGRAIANVVLGGTVGAIVGPLVVAPAGAAALRLGTDELVGPFAAAVALQLIAAAVTLIWLRPDPRELGKQVSARFPPPAMEKGSRGLSDILRLPAAQLAIGAMVLGQMVMVMLMVITSLHMRQHNHGLGSISAVISAHTLGMYAFSVVSGRLADRWGRGRVILLGSGLLVLAGLIAPLSPEVLPLAASLFLLGLGWNLSFVGGSSLLADQLRPEERGRAQGFNDLLISLGSAVGSLGSGVAFASVGYTVMGLIGAALALIPLIMALLWLRRVGWSPAAAGPG
ncbi:MAG TPA: MFS transporter [Anaerolineales bacterium]|nr:MFS transporter [Anaerolineales bacterium]